MTKKLSRIVALMLAVIMSFSMLLVPVEAASFKDVSNKAWYKAAVDYVAERGWMAGVSSNTFGPNVKVTRAMAVTVLAKMSDAKLDGSAPAFSDTADGAWYTKAASWAADFGIVSGVGDGKFAPNRAITRQDLCTILYKFVNVKAYELEPAMERTFNDMDSVAGYATEAVSFCAAAGLVSGFEDSTFRPQQTATRAQLAVIMMKLDLLLHGEPVPMDPMPAQYFEDTTEEGMTVRVNAPEGALPTDTEMILNTVEDDSVYDAINAQVVGKVLSAADITFIKNGAEIEPKKAVEVQISVDGLNQAENPTVVHVRDDGSVEFIENANLVSVNRSGNEQAMSFRSADFSVYAVVDGDPTNPDTKSIKYEFYYGEDPYMYVNDGKETYYQYVGEGETLYYPGSPAYDVEIEAADPNARFLGWYTKNGTEWGERILNPDTDCKEGIVITGIAETKTVKLYARYSKTYYLVYHDERITPVIATVTSDVPEIQVKKDNGDWVQDYSPMGEDAASMTFLGWTDDTDTNTLVGQTVDLSAGTVHLYPVVAMAKWISFDKNDWTYIPTSDVSQAEYIFDTQTNTWVFVGKNHGGTHIRNGTGANYVGPRAVQEGHTVQQDIPNTLPTTVRPGYNFLGWWDDEKNTQWTNASGQYLNGIENQELQKNVLLSAHWEATNANYTIIVWKQQITDPLDAEANGTELYDVEFAETITTAKTGDVVTVPEKYQNIQNGDPVEVDGITYDFTGYHHDTETFHDELQGTVAADGSLTLNVYYNRNIITMNFHSSDDAGTYVPAENGDYYYYSDSNQTGYYFIGTGPNSTYVPATGEQIYRRTSNQDNTNTPNQTFLTNNVTTHTIASNYTYVAVGGGTGKQFWQTQESYLIFFTRTVYYPLYYRYENQSGYYEVGTGPDPTAVGTHNLNSGTTTYIGLYEQEFKNWDGDYVWEDTSNQSILSFLSSFKLPNNKNTVIDLYRRGKGTITHDVYFYKQTLNSDYVEDFHYRSDTNGNFLITDKYPGFTAYGYKRKNRNTNTWPQNITTLENGPDAEGNYAEITMYANNTYYDLIVYYKRNEYTISYIDSTNMAALGSHENHLYEAPLTDHGTNAATTTPYGSMLPAVNTYEGMYFTGWYADASCTTKIFFDTPTEDQLAAALKVANDEQIDSNGNLKYTVYKAMPMKNLVFYAGYNKYRYRVYIQPNGGILSETESSYFNINWNETIERYNDVETSRNYIQDPDGEYYYVVFDHDLNRRIFYISKTDIESDYRYTNGSGQEVLVTSEQMKSHRLLDEDGNPITYSYVDKAYTFYGWYEVINKEMGHYGGPQPLLPPEIDDNDMANGNLTPYTFGEPADHDIAIRAIWKRGGYVRVKFDTGEHSAVEIDPSGFIYTDLSDCIALEAPEMDAESVAAGYYFVGWETPNHELVQTNDVFKVMVDYAEKLEELAEDGEPQYEFTVKALYRTNSELTTLTYDVNAPEGKTASSSTLTNTGYPVNLDGNEITGYSFANNTLSNIMLNSRIKLSTGEGFTVNGYSFIGWNDVEADADAGKVKFTPGKIYGIGKTSVEPGNTLYAVWSTDYYVYNSGTGKLTAHAVPEDPDETVDLATFADGEFLYGGSFKAFGGITEDEIAAAKSKASAAEDKTTIVSAAADLYNGDKIYTNGNDVLIQDENGYHINPNRYWKSANKITAAIAPVAGEVYYIKEVPNTYLKFKVLKVNDWGNGKKLADLYLLSDVDDNIYSEVGFKVLKLTPEIVDGVNLAMASKGNSVDALAKEFTFSSKDLNMDVVVNQDNFSVTHTLIGALRQNSLINETAGYLVMPYWVTYDGKTIYNSVRLMEVNTTDNKVTLSDYEIPNRFFVNANGEFFDGDGFKDWTEVNGVPDVAILKATFKDATGAEEAVVLTKIEGTEGINKVLYCDVPEMSGKIEKVKISRHQTESSNAWNSTAYLVFSWNNLNNNYLKHYKAAGTNDEEWCVWAHYPEAS